MTSASEEPQSPRSEVTEIGSPSTRAPDSPTDKASSTTITIQDRITPAELPETDFSRVNTTPDNEKARLQSKTGSVRVRVSRRSTETGVSKVSSRRLSIRWPNTPKQGPQIHWYTPTMMILLGFAGLLGALGHHLYNTSLDGKEVGDAQWPQRFGVALAFFVKMTLVGAVQTAVKQRAWLTVKKRGFRVRTLDSIFHACYDPIEFFDRELFRGAFWPALLALLVWILPLSAIASPSTLTAGNLIHNSTATCFNVSTLNFGLENGFGITKRDPAVDKQGMSFWDVFANGTSFFNQPSMDNRRIFQLSLLSEQPLQPANPCPSNSNCSYSLSFAAPSYKCEPRDDFGGIRTNNMTQMAPYGDLVYASYSSFEEDFVGRPLDWNRTVPNNDTGVFKKEPTLWVGWSWNTTLRATADNATQWNTSYWGHQLRPHVVECTLWNSTYEYDLSFQQGKMVVLKYAVRPNVLMLSPDSVMAPFRDNYMEYAGFHGIGWLYRTMLAGNISQAGESSWVMTQSDISQTQILDPGNGMAYDEDLPLHIEQAFHNIFLAYLSDLKQNSQKFVDMPCEATAQLLAWSYKPTWLAVSYFIAVGLTFAAITVGLHAIAVNGYVAQTNFSTFLTTTRNPDLDQMAEGACLGEWPMEKDLRETRLRFGQTAAQPGRPPHAAFGFVDQVTTIEKGKAYM